MPDTTMKTHAPMRQSIRSPLGQRDDRLTVVAWIILVSAAMTFAVIAFNVVVPGRIAAFDLRMVDALHAATTPLLTSFMLPVSDLHGVFGIGVMSVLLAACLHRLRRRGWVLGLVFAVPGGLLFNSLLKLIFHRPRPVFDHPIVTLHTFSFPSGHVAGTTVFYGVLAAWLITRTNSVVIRVVIAFGVLLIIALVAASRMYLGAHYPSDVAAGFVEGVGWLALCLLITRQLAQRRLVISQDCQ